MSGHLQKSFNIGQWITIFLLIASSGYGLALGINGKDKHRTTTRLSPTTIRLVQDTSDPNLFTGLLPLSNKLDGRITRLKLHTGCKCTVVDKPPETIDNGKSTVSLVYVKIPRVAKQHVLIDFEFERWDDKIPCSEVVVLEGISKENLPGGPK
jgi:hypothetical protein